MLTLFLTAIVVITCIVISGLWAASCVYLTLSIISNDKPVVKYIKFITGLALSIAGVMIMTYLKGC